MSRKSIIVLFVFAGLIAATVLIWRTKAAQSEAIRKTERIEANIVKGLSDDEIQLIMAHQARMDPSKALSIVQTAESRRAFLKGLSEYLALAARARRDGLGDDPNILLVIQNQQKSLLTDLYLTKAEGEGKVIEKLTPEQLEQVWADPMNEKEFNAEVEAAAAVQKDTAEKTENPMGVSPPRQGESLEKLKKGWARAKILSDMAKGDGEFINDPLTQLRLKILEAGILSNSCLAKYWKDRIKATDKEIASFLGAHPEYDLNRKSEKARSLLSRVKAGEDISKLAKEFSEHRSTQEKGGFYDENLEGPLPDAVRQTLSSMAPGQFADQVVETPAGFEVVQLVSKVKKSNEQNDNFTFVARRILLQKLFEDPEMRRPDIPPPFVSAQEIARSSVQKGKRDSFVAEMIESERIVVPEDFAFELTDAMKRIRDDETRVNDLIRKDQEKLKREKAKTK
jgi:PPIC-type PPIASE domain